jgi:hypothetical protein
VPSCSKRPWFITPTWSDNTSASDWSWVMYTNVVPKSACSCLSSIFMCSRSFRSSAPSGSSSSSSVGSSTMLRAMATRCRWPPDSWSTRFSPALASPTRSSMAAALRARSALSTPRRASP